MAVAEATRVKVPVIQTAADHAAALARLNELAERDDPDEDAEAKALGLLIAAYEREAFPIPTPDPIDAIRFRMAELGYSQAELARALELGRGRVSELLNRKRRLPLDIIRSLAQLLGLSPAVLIQPYETEGRTSAADG